MGLRPVAGAYHKDEKKGPELHARVSQETFDEAVQENIDTFDMEPEEALRFAAQVEGLRWVKVGLELFVQGGPAVVAQLREQGLRVFLDLKFHDIPATMAGACHRAATLGAELITVHACAGSDALKAAQAAALEGAQCAGQPAPTLLAVTVLTSWEEERLQRELSE